MNVRMSLERLLRPGTVAHAHCDLPCGIYDPAQARIEAESVKAIQERYQNAEQMKTAGQTVEDYRARCLVIKEERADLVKHHLWVLWTDYFTPAHLEKFPQLHQSLLDRHQGSRPREEDLRPGPGPEAPRRHR